MIGVMCLMFCLHFEKIFCLSSNRFQVAVASMQDAKDVVELTVLREPNEPIPLSSYVVICGPNQWTMIGVMCLMFCLHFEKIFCLSSNRFQVAVASMQDAKDVVELTVLREPNEPIPLSSYVASPNQSLDMSFMSETADSSSSTKETISTAIRRDLDGSPGFSVAGGKGASTGDPIVISYLTPGGAAERDGKLRVGDRVLSINGTNMRGARHDQAVALLTSFSSNEIYLVVQRDRPGTPASASLQVAPSSTKSAPAARSPPAVAPRQSPQQACGFGDSSWDGKTEEVDLVRENHSLGLSIVGGSDHSSHPFGVNAPGVFISKITANSPAARSQKLRIGDRILFVNDVDVRNAKHQTAVEALKRSEPTVRLRVTHEPQPSGLREVILRRSCGEPLGLRICGGINSPPANPLDKTDEGIFVEKVERGGAAAGSSLAPGVRILEVNDESLLGCSQEEAARVLRRSGETVRLLVCDAFTSSPSMSCSRLSGSSERHQTVSASPSPAIAHFPQVGSPNASASALVRDGICVSLLDDGPLATSSPIPPPLVHQPVRPSTSSSSPLPLAPPPPRAATSPSGAVRSVPPPVAPKPKINPKQNGVTHESVPLASLDDQLESEPAAGSSQVSTPSTPNSNPERMAFSSKLKKFEREIEIKRPSPLPSSSAPLLPAKRPLLNEDEVRKMKEEESKKVTPSVSDVGISPLEEDANRSFEHILNNRYKSLEADSAAAEEVMLQVQQINSRLANISEDSTSVSSPLPSNERILQNETSFERREYTDPITGAATISLIERSITQREIDTSSLLQKNSPSDFGYADDELKESR
uniref:PDZ domain-containing protein n=1 Tax=Ascaris lumbricoides TaxID=6252 RepID=A0A9J2PGG8_ASCLU